MAPDDPDLLATALSAFGEEVAALAAFDQARDAVVALIQVGASPDEVHAALHEVARHRAWCGQLYFALEAILVEAKWRIPDGLPAALRAALDEQIPAQEEHLARTAAADRLVAAWKGEEAHHNEAAPTRRSHRRRRGA